MQSTQIMLIDNYIIGLSPHVFWIILALSIVTLASVITIIVLAVRFSRSKKRISQNKKRAPKVKVIDSIRYSANEECIEEADGSANVTHNSGDITLIQGKLYTARRNGNLLPGKYTMLTVSEGQEQFGVRIGRYMRTYKHGDTIVLAEGETIVCHSHPIMLR